MKRAHILAPSREPEEFFSLLDEEFPVIRRSILKVARFVKANGVDGSAAFAILFEPEYCSVHRIDCPFPNADGQAVYDVVGVGLDDVAPLGFRDQLAEQGLSSGM